MFPISRLREKSCQNIAPRPSAMMPAAHQNHLMSKRPQRGMLSRPATCSESGLLAMAWSVSYWTNTLCAEHTPVLSLEVARKVIEAPTLIGAFVLSAEYYAQITRY